MHYAQRRQVSQVTTFERLAAAIGYPSDEISPVNGVLSLLVDGAKVEVREAGGRMVFSRSLGKFDDDSLRRLAGYAAGRVMKEDAVLAWEPASDDLFLWQDVPTSASDVQLRRVFDVFCASCDWWLARAGEENVSKERVPATMIRP